MSRSSARIPSVACGFENGAPHDAFDAAAREAGVLSAASATTKTLLLVPPTTYPLASSKQALLHGVSAKLELREHLLEAA